MHPLTPVSYTHLDVYKRQILSFLVFLDSIQTANLPCIGEYITANEINLCLSIQTFQECVHSQSYSYMLDSICSPVERNDILYQWKNDAHLLRRNTFIGDLYNEFQEKKDDFTLLKVMMANYILEGIYSVSYTHLVRSSSRNSFCDISYPPFPFTSVILSIISSSLFPYNCDFAVHNLFIYHSKFFHFINIVSSFLLTIL